MWNVDFCVNPNHLVTNQITLGATGVGVPLSNQGTGLNRGIIIKNSSASGVAAIGNKSVTVNDGFTLGPGEHVNVFCNDASQVYAIGSTGVVLTWLSL